MYTIYGRIYIKESTNNEENHKLTPWGGGGEMIFNKLQLQEHSYEVINPNFHLMQLNPTTFRIVVLSTCFFLT